MTNTTEMPVEIWSQPDDLRNWTGEWDTHGGEGELDVSYTRTDTIPSRAQVAREFEKAIEAKMFRILNNIISPEPNKTPFQQAREEVLKEWEAAECQ